MKYLHLALALGLLIPPGVAFPQLALDIVYPREDQIVTATDSTFIFGSVSAPNSRILVNNIPVRVYSNGAFLGVVPVSAGEFIFRCEAFSDSQSVEVLRKVTVPPYLATTSADSIAIDSSFVFPAEDLELQPGDYLEVTCKGTPGLTTTFSIPGLVEAGAMAEASPRKAFYWGEAVFGEGKAPVTPDIHGVYHGVIRIPDSTALDSAEIEFTLGGTNGIDLKVTAPGRLTVRRDAVPRVAELTAELTVARTGPGLGYQLFLPAGVKLWLNGKRGSYYRARLNDEENVWVPASSLAVLPAGTPIPSSTIATVRSESLPSKAKVKVFMQEKLPFRIEQTNNPSSLTVLIFGATSNTDWIRYDFDDPSIKQLSWSQPRDGVYQLRIELKHRQQWGYDPYYEDSNLIIEIRRPPTKLSLKELLICVDPGHGPDDGAIGPTRVKEKDANLQLALVLQEKLQKKGARVFLTRKDQHGAGLGVRPKLAALMEADILLSIHHNALPDGVNPFKSRGSSTYYYHAQSRPLAGAIQKRLVEKLKLPNFGLYYDNLALCRPPQMPAVLIESAFIMHPEEEMLINSRSYRQKAADAIIKGIEDFLKASKE